MKMVCVYLKNNEDIEFDKLFTVGKVYDIEDSNGSMRYMKRITKDDGESCLIDIKDSRFFKFVPIDEWREKQINIILNDQDRNH
jgi:hypothetical protein